MSNEAAKQDNILDVVGNTTGFKFTLRNSLFLVAAILISVLLYAVGPSIGLESHQAGLMLGLICATVILWIANVFETVYCLLIFIAASIVCGLFTFADVQTTLGSSQMLMMLGMLIVAEGASQTPIARRLAYFFLLKFGRSQALMLLAMFLATAVLSAFCANLASTVVMASICVGIVRELDAVDPGSRNTIGRATMIIIPIGAFLGGMSLMSGNPGLNLTGVTNLTNSSNGLTITYAQWTAVGLPSALLLAIPIWLIYKTYFHVPSKGAAIEASYFKNKLDELGKLGGSEIRWIILVAAMVISLIAGVNNGVAALTCGVIAMLPGIGCLNSKKAIKSLPVGLLLMIGLNTTLALGFRTYGIAGWLSGFFTPILGGLPPFILMLACGYIMVILNNLFVGAAMGIIAVLITVFTPIVMALGYNPALILMPAIFLGASTNVIGSQVSMYITYQYGFWDINDTIVPGILLNAIAVPVLTIVSYFVGPLVGLGLYL